MHNGLSCTAEARSVPASTAATAAEENDTLRDNGTEPERYAGVSTAPRPSLPAALACAHGTAILMFA